MSKKLICGVIALAAVLGFMAVGSATPVTGVIIPLIFSILAGAFAFFQKSTVARLYESLPKLPESDAERKKLLAKWQTQEANLPDSFGTLLIAFAVAYLIGSLIGASLRSGVFPAHTETRTPPWAEGNAPSDVFVALSWLTLQDKLKGWGYNQSQIQNLYKSFAQQAQTLASDPTKKENFAYAIRQAASEYPKPPRAVFRSHRLYPLFRV